MSKCYCNYNKQKVFCSGGTVDFIIFIFYVLHSTLLRLRATVSEDAGTDPRTLATLASGVRRSNHSARFSSTLIPIYRKDFYIFSSSRYLIVCSTYFSRGLVAPSEHLYCLLMHLSCFLIGYTM